MQSVIKLYLKVYGLRGKQLYFESLGIASRQQHDSLLSQLY